MVITNKYKGIWENLYADDDLLCEREVGNAHNTYIVAVRKNIAGETTTVGHIPRKISSIRSIFIRRGGEIQCIVNGYHCYSSDLLQGGLCVLKFISKRIDKG